MASDIVYDPFLSLYGGSDVPLRHILDVVLGILFNGNAYICATCIVPHFKLSGLERHNIFLTYAL